MPALIPPLVGGHSACKDHFSVHLHYWPSSRGVPGSGGSWENFPHADVVIWNHSSGVSGLSSLPPCPSPSLNCVPCLRQMGVICLCELPITRRTRDTYHSKWGCHPPTPWRTTPLLFFLLFLLFLWLPLQQRRVPADSYHGSSEIRPPPQTHTLTRTLQSHSLCNLGVQRTDFITTLLILSSTLSSLLSPVFFIFLYSNKAASQKPSLVHPFSFP